MQSANEAPRHFCVHARPRALASGARSREIGLVKFFFLTPFFLSPLCPTSLTEQQADYKRSPPPPHFSRMFLD